MKIAARRGATHSRAHRHHSQAKHCRSVRGGSAERRKGFGTGCAAPTAVSWFVVYFISVWSLCQRGQGTARLLLTARTGCSRRSAAVMQTARAMWARAAVACVLLLAAAAGVHGAQGAAAVERALHGAIPAHPSDAGGGRVASTGGGDAPAAASPPHSALGPRGRRLPRVVDAAAAGGQGQRGGEGGALAPGHRIRTAAAAAAAAAIVVVLALAMATLLGACCSKKKDRGARGDRQRRDTAVRAHADNAHYNQNDDGAAPQPAYKRSLPPPPGQASASRPRQSSPKPGRKGADPPPSSLSGVEFPTTAQREVMAMPEVQCAYTSSAGSRPPAAATLLRRRARRTARWVRAAAGCRVSSTLPLLAGRGSGAGKGVH